MRHVQRIAVAMIAVQDRHAGEQLARSISESSSSDLCGQSDIFVCNCCHLSLQIRHERINDRPFPRLRFVSNSKMTVLHQNDVCIAEAGEMVFMRPCLRNAEMVDVLHKCLNSSESELTLL
jgi:hypothetical protein